MAMCEKAPSLVTEDSNILGVSRLYVGGYNLSNWIILSRILRSKPYNGKKWNINGFSESKFENTKRNKKLVKKVYLILLRIRKKIAQLETLIQTHF